MAGPTFVIHGAVTDTHSSAKHRVGTVYIAPNGNEYTYIQADDAITVNQAVKMDSTTGVKVTPTAAVSDMLFGVAETAIADEYYGWITTKGVASCLVADSMAVGDPMASSGTAGTLTKAVEAGSGDYEHVRAELLAANSSGAAAARAVRLF